MAEHDSTDPPLPDRQAGGDGGPAGGGAGESGAFLQVAAVLLGRRRLIAGSALGAALIAVAIVLVLPREYTCTASLMPQSSTSQLSQLAGLAAQFGVNVPVAQSGESPEFYAGLLRSRHLLSATVAHRYVFPRDPLAPDDTLRGDLVELFDTHEDERPRSIDRAADELSDRLSITTHSATSVVDVGVTTRWPVLSQEIVQRMLDLVNTFNLETRQTQAAAERRFLQDRVKQAREDLRTVEDSLQRFLEHNRRYQNSPELQFEYDRLQRRVTLQQQVYTTLEQAFEQAKIEEVRNTPVITVVDPAEVPPRPDKRHLPLWGLLGLVVGGFGAVFWALAGDMLRRTRSSDPEDYAAFRRQLDGTQEDLRRLWARAREAARRVRRGRRPRDSRSGDGPGAGPGDRD